jgi:hypothetical protein
MATMTFTLPTDADDGGVTVMELVAMLGVGMWAGGLIWLVVHLLTRLHHHDEESDTPRLRRP